MSHPTQLNLGRIRGLSAYEEWKQIDGNEGKTFQEFMAAIGLLSFAPQVTDGVTDKGVTSQGIYDALTGLRDYIDGIAETIPSLDGNVEQGETRGVTGGKVYDAIENAKNSIGEVLYDYSDLGTSQENTNHVYVHRSYRIGNFLIEAGKIFPRYIVPNFPPTLGANETRHILVRFKYKFNGLPTTNATLHIAGTGIYPLSVRATDDSDSRFVLSMLNTSSVERGTIVMNWVAIGKIKLSNGNPVENTDFTTPALYTVEVN